jgi:predicted HicB family RNase H-like nuclease
MIVAKTDKRRGEPEERRVEIRVRLKPSVKAIAELLAHKEGRSMADWIERLIARERARRAGKRKIRRTILRS